ncbi:MAG: hypothetical protein Fur0018_02790 [Anaerolineales bacterium]
MKFFFETPFHRLTSQEQRRIITPAFGLILVVVGSLFIFGLYPGVSAQIRQAYLGASIFFGLYSWLLLRHILPYIATRRVLRWLILGGHAIGLPVIAIFFPGVGQLFDAVLSPITVLFVVILLGRWAAYTFIFFNESARLLIAAAWIVHSPAHYALIVAIPLFNIALAEVAIRIGQILDRRIAHLEAINHVARRVGSTIEAGSVLDLLSVAIREALPADTYYIGIQRDGVLRLEVLYDDGKFFPPQDVAPENSVTALVIQRRESLLLTNVPEDLRQLGLEPQTIGEERVSLSWMGTPMAASDRFIGVVAVGAYQRAAFTPGDLELLESIAQQAALALDNAFHHAEVEEQSRRDSLTGVYNHGYFLLALNEQARLAQIEGTLLSVIMLDIDFFKSYNDSYGHLVGDQVLIHFADIIRRHIKETDLLGRWGGEEFIIALPGATGEQAVQVAERISESLHALQLRDRDDGPIAPPTISQGIALFPHEADDIYTLIDLADQRLYHAKASGRNQIYPPLAHWARIKVE